jgi:hypothetical protein
MRTDANAPAMARVRSVDRPSATITSTIPG